MESIRFVDAPLIRISSKKFCLRESLQDAVLKSLIRKQGLTLPLVCVENGKKFELISGHKRLAILKELKKKNIAIFLISPQKDQTLFFHALSLNSPTSYSDLDRCFILQKAELEFGMDKPKLQNELLPLIGLAPSSKVLQQYQQVAALPVFVRKKIRDGQIPFHGSFWLSRFSAKELDFLTRKLFTKVRLTASQLAHISEWLLDIRAIKKISLESIFTQNKLQVVNKNQDMRRAADIFYQTLRRVRFPALALKEEVFEKTARTLEGTVQGLEIRAPDHFEQEGFQIYANICNPTQLKAVLRQLQETENQLSGLFDTLL